MQDACTLSCAPCLLLQDCYLPLLNSTLSRQTDVMFYKNR